MNKQNIEFFNVYRQFLLDIMNLLKKEKGNNKHSITCIKKFIERYLKEEIEEAPPQNETHEDKNKIYLQSPSRMKIDFESEDKKELEYGAKNNYFLEC